MLIENLWFSPNLTHMLSCDLSLHDVESKPIVWKLPGQHIQHEFSDCKTDIFLIRYKDNFLKRGETKIKSKQFSETLTSQIMQNCPDVSLGRFLTFDLDLEPLFHEKLRACLSSVHWKRMTVVVLNLAHRMYLHQPSVSTSIASLDQHEDYLLKDLENFSWINWSDLTQDGHGQLGPKERSGGNRWFIIKSRQVYLQWSWPIYHNLVYLQLDNMFKFISRSLCRCILFHLCL